MVKRNWHAIQTQEIFKKLESSEKGLSSSDAEKKLKKYGPNKLKKKKKKSPISLFIEQFESFLVILLISAIGIAIFVGEIIDATVILIIVIANAILGFVQEYRAERAMEALKKLSSPGAIVVRDGNEKKISASKLVPGDIIILNEGDRVPAAARLLETHSLQIDESNLTGESTPAEKEVKKLAEKTALADRKNMIFMNTNVTRGRGRAVVVATGMDTEIGHVAEMIQTTEERKTPLQKKLSAVGKSIGSAVVLITLLIFGLGIFRGEEIFNALMTSIALAVAAVPEGLPAVVTITLAIGLSRMAKAKSIIRKLPAVETLGATTVICSDKTGTLTKNQMTVRKIYLNHQTINLEGNGYTPKGNFIINNKKMNPQKSKELKLLLKIGMLCNTAKLQKKKEKYRVIGDPTEGALIVSAEKAGIHHHQELSKKYKSVGEIPFDSNRKMMSSCYITPTNKKTAYTKGAPEILLKKCTRIFKNGKVHKITEKDRKEILKSNKEMAKSALRVLGMAYRVLPSKLKKFNPKNTEKNLVFVGLQAMIDPPREEVKKSIKTCKDAGIKPIMITGDHEITAKAIAEELKILKKGDSVLTGRELDKLNEKQFQKRLENISVYARVSPEHKVRILKAWHKKGEVVAMTGDGVNDAPALKNADIGVAMGISGTDVAKQASSMVLQDDNFSTIIKAIEQGRGIYENIRKFVRYLLSSNIGEVMVIFAASLMGLPLPLIAVQILWMNLLTDGVPALALGLDSPEKDVMKKPPRDPKEKTINKKMWKFILEVGTIITIGTVFVFWKYLSSSENHARTMAFTTIIMFQMWNVFNSRTEKSIFSREFWSNKWLLLAVASSVALQLIIINTPLFHNIFDVTFLNAIDWIWVALVSFSVVMVVELKKIINKTIKNR